MNAGTAFVLLIVAAIVALALRSVFKKKGSACGCSGGCSSCDGCKVKVYGINIDADGNPMDCSSCPHCK